MNGTMATGNGVLFLFYTKDEEAAVKRVQKELIKRNILPMAVNDPKNFRFVSAERISDGDLGLIGRLALKNLGYYGNQQNFVRDLQNALASEPAATEPK